MRPVTLAVLILACGLPSLAADGIRVTATCPGADARTLDETVLIPLFQQISGIEGMTRIETEARNDGGGTLTVYFHSKADMNLAEVRVQNRVNLALPRLPEPCRQMGLSVRKLPAGPPQVWLGLTSTDSNHDEDFLNKYAMINLMPEYTRVPGVTDARLINGGDFGMQVWLNPVRLAAYRLTDIDVIDSLRRQNAQVGASGAIGGKLFYHAVTASGRLSRPEDFENVILRASADGEVLRLKDVARVAIEATMSGFARVDGRPAALIEITAWPGRVTADRLVKNETAGVLPPGMNLLSLADRSADHLLLVELRLPGGSTLAQTDDVVAKATELMRGLAGKPSIFALAEVREPNAAMLFIKVRAEGGPTAADVEKALAGISGAMIRIGDAPAGKEAFPVRMALMDPTEFSDPGAEGEQRFREAADRVLATLVKDKDVTGPSAFPLSSAPQTTIDVNRDLCAQYGVGINDLFTSLQTSLGGVHATEFSRFGRTYRVTVQTAPEFARFPEDLEKLMVRGSAGEMVSLDKLIKLRDTRRPTAVVRVNGYRAIIITAAPALGKSPAQVAAKCVKLALDALPKGHRAMDLSGP